MRQLEPVGPGLQAYSFTFESKKYM